MVAKQTLYWTFSYSQMSFYGNKIGYLNCWQCLKTSPMNMKRTAWFCLIIPWWVLHWLLIFYRRLVKAKNDLQIHVLCWKPEFCNWAKLTMLILKMMVIISNWLMMLIFQKDQYLISFVAVSLLNSCQKTILKLKIWLWKCGVVNFQPAAMETSLDTQT